MLSSQVGWRAARPRAAKSHLRWPLPVLHQFLEALGQGYGVPRDGTRKPSRSWLMISWAAPAMEAMAGSPKRMPSR